MTDAKWFEPKPDTKFQRTYILPLGKNTYSFVGASNRVDAWHKFIQQVPRSQLAGMTYKDVLTSEEYFHSKK